MKTNSKFLILPMMITLFAMGIPQELKQMNYLAYLKSDKSAWKNNVAFAMKLYQDQPSADTEFQLAFTEYGLLSASMVDMDIKLFESYVDECENRLEKLAAGKKYGADAKALLSGLYGYKIAHFPLKAMLLGSKSSGLLEQAMKQNPESSIVLKMYASNQYFTPEMWGGNKALALKAFEKSTQKLLGTDLEKSWIHLDNLAWTGILQKEMGDSAKAKSTWEKALVIEPEFYWVSKSLLPSLN